MKQWHLVKGNNFGMHTHFWYKTCSLRQLNFKWGKSDQYVEVGLGRKSQSNFHINNSIT